MIDTDIVAQQLLSIVNNKQLTPENTGQIQTGMIDRQTWCPQNTQKSYAVFGSSALVARLVGGMREGVKWAHRTGLICSKR